MSVETVNTGDNASNAGEYAETTLSDSREVSKKSGKKLRLLCNPQKLPKSPRMATQDCRGVPHCEDVDKELRDYFYHSTVRAARRRKR